MVCLGRGYSLVGMLAVALTAGCGIDVADADGSGGGDADTDNGTGLTGPGTTGASTDTGPTGATDDTWGESSGSGVPDPFGTDGEDDTGPAAGCEDLDCSGGGYCEPGDNGPTCVCDTGWASVGLDCIPCDVIDGAPLPAVVPTVETRFRFQIDGATPPTSLYENARVWLRNRASGDSVLVGATRDGSANLLMVPGIYDVVYAHREGSQLPQNEGAVLAQLEVDENTDIEVDVPTSTFQGQIVFAAGDKPGNDLYDYGRIWLVSPTTGDRVLVGTTRDEQFRINVVPGSYELRYEVRESQGTAPANTDGFLDFVNIAPGEHEATIEISTSQVTGQMLFDGTTQDSIYDNGDLELRDVQTGDRFPLGGTEDVWFARPLLAGTYEVIYTSREPGDRSPVNKSAIVDTFVVGESDLEHDIDIRTVVVDGSFTLNGDEPPTDQFDDGVVLLEGTNGDTVVLGNTATGGFSQRVVEGAYDVVYSQDTAGTSMPVNTRAHLEMVNLKQNTTLEVEIPVVEVVGNLTIAGDEAPDSPYDDGRLFLQNTETGDTVLLGNTREGNYAARVVPGTYDVVYKNEFSEVFLPVNQGAVVLQGVLIDGANPLDIDVPVSTLEGAVQIQNSTPSIDEGIGNLFLRDVNSGDEVFIGHTGAANFSKPLTNGTYLMEYRGVAAEGATLGASLPANEKAAFACFEVVSE